MEIENLSHLIEVSQSLDKAEIRPVEVLSERMDSYISIWNTTRNQLESIVERKNSTLIQHNAAFECLCSALQEKGIEVNGELVNNAGTVITELIFRDIKIKTHDDIINLGIRVVNTYNGRAGPRLELDGFGFRGKCSNGMFLGQSLVGIFRQKHTKIADLQKSILEFINHILKRGAAFKLIIEDADTDRVTDSREVLKAVLKGKKKVIAVMDKFENRDITRYTIYNALTDYATHNAANYHEQRKIQRIAQKILITPQSELKRESWKGK